MNRNLLGDLPLDHEFSVHRFSGVLKNGDTFDFSLIGSSNIDICYYTDINMLAGDLENGTIGKHGYSGFVEGSIFIFNKKTMSIELFCDTIIDSPFVFNGQVFNNISFNLNGFDISSSGPTIIEITDVQNFRINADGSCINLDTQSNNNLMVISNSSCTVNGGDFRSTSVGGSLSSPTAIAKITNSIVDFNSSSLDITERNNNKAVSAICATDNSTISINDGFLRASTKDSYALCVQLGKTGGVDQTTFTAVDTQVVANADYGNGVGGIGVKNDGLSVNLENCNVYGTHSGIQTRGHALIDGGEFCSFGHGGVYATSHTSDFNSEIRIKNAKLYCSPVLNGYKNDVDGNDSALYIGGKDNIKVYVDNCIISAEIQPIVVKDTTSEGNNHLYISNSLMNNTLNNINGYKTGGGIYGCGIRIRHNYQSDNFITFGMGCDFNPNIINVDDIYTMDSIEGMPGFMRVRPNYLRLNNTSSTLNSLSNYYDISSEVRYDF